MEYPSLSDSSLLDDFVRRGNEDSFSEIVRRHEFFVRGVAARVLGEGPDAEDAAQAAFVALAFDARRVDATRGLGPWLHRVTLRAALDVRKSALRRLDRESVASSQSISSPPEPCDGLDEAIEKLPEKIRRSIVDHYIGGWSIEDIARRDKCSTSAISMRLSRGRELLRKEISAPAAVATALLAQQMPNTIFLDNTLKAVRILKAAKSSAALPLLEIARRALRPTWRELIAPMLGGAAAVTVIAAVALSVGSSTADEVPKQPPVSSNASPIVTNAVPVERGSTSVHPLIAAIKRNYRWETMNKFVSVLDAYQADINTARDSDGKTALHIAVSKHDEEFAALMALRGADVSSVDGAGYTPLFYAVKDDLTWTVLFLVLRGANVNHIAPDGTTPLGLAIRSGNVNLAEMLLWIGAKPIPVSGDIPSSQQPLALAKARGKAEMIELIEAYTKPGANVMGSENAGLPAFVRNPLHEAARKGDFPMLSKLLSGGLGVNIRDEKGRTALHEAISAGQAEVVFYLLIMGADANALDNQNRSPMGSTMGWLGGGLDANRRFLLAKGANPQAIRNDGHTELTWAVMRDNEHGVQWLLWMGVDPRQRTKNGTPFEVAVQEGNQRLIDLLRRNGVDGPTRLSNEPRWLLDNGAKRGDLATIDEALQNGANIDEPNAKGDTPLIAAIGKRNVPAARHLLVRGADMDVVNPKTGYTPLLTTMVWDYPEMTDFRKELLEAGVDPNVPSQSGETPLMRGVWHHPTKPLMQLIEYGADLNARDKSGKTALGRAVAKGQVKTADYLRSLGAQE